jgi:OOP family OmpA-OmpF porin
MDVVIDLRGVNFDFDSARLRPDAIATLDEAVSILRRYDTIRVEVAGHTCSIGDEAYNQRLSERRAKVVFDYLVEKGIAANRLNWVGYGESRPIASNDTREGRVMNRRTELKVRND